METNEWKLLDKSWCNLTNYDCSCAGCAVKVSLTFRGTQYSKMAPVKVSKKTASAWWMPPKIVKIIYCENVLPPLLCSGSRIDPAMPSWLAADETTSLVMSWSQLSPRPGCSSCKHVVTVAITPSLATRGCSLQPALQLLSPDPGCY